MKIFGCYCEEKDKQIKELKESINKLFNQQEEYIKMIKSYEIMIKEKDKMVLVLMANQK